MARTATAPAAIKAVAKPRLKLTKMINPKRIFCKETATTRMARASTQGTRPPEIPRGSKFFQVRGRSW